jgi:hypothetical protein
MVLCVSGLSTQQAFTSTTSVVANFLAGIQFPNGESVSAEERSLVWGCRRYPQRNETKQLPAQKKPGLPRHERQQCHRALLTAGVRHSITPLAVPGGEVDLGSVRTTMNTALEWSKLFPQ